MFTKLDLIERIIATTDEKVLEKVGKALATEKDEFAFTKLQAIGEIRVAAGELLDLQHVA